MSSRRIGAGDGTPRIEAPIAPSRAPAPTMAPAAVAWRSPDVPVDISAGVPKAQATVGAASLLRLQTSGFAMDVVVAAARAHLEGGLPLIALDSRLQGAVVALLGAPSRAFLDTPPPEPTADRAAMRRSLCELAAATHALVLQNAERVHDAGPERRDALGEHRDWHRTWGLSLLPEGVGAPDNPFNEGQFLVDLHLEATRSSTTLGNRRSPTNARTRFETAVQHFVPNVRVLAYTDNGTEAVSLTFDIAAHCGRLRQDEASATLPVMAFFDGVYGGGRGLAAGMSRHRYGLDVGRRDAMEPFRVTSPTSYSWPITDPTEIARLQPLEDEALASITRLASEGPPGIGAIFIEPMQGSTGMRFYRPEFMRRLRDLADELGLPIIADEVLTSGGRTGRFFAYQNYEGFEPDFVTFGKGMHICGVAEVIRPGKLSTQQGPASLGATTTGGDSVRMLRGARVLEAIAEHGYLENARTTGAYLVSQLRAVEAELGREPSVSGVGCFIGAQPIPHLEELVSGSKAGTRRRYLPVLSLSRQDVDALIRDLRRKNDLPEATP